VLINRKVASSNRRCSKPRKQNSQPLTVLVCQCWAEEAHVLLGISQGWRAAWLAHVDHLAGGQHGVHEVGQLSVRINLQEEGNVQSPTVVNQLDSCE
jgi:hypothetical protein